VIKDYNSTLICSSGLFCQSKHELQTKKTEL
jgi:hypothetical protein